MDLLDMDVLDIWGLAIHMSIINLYSSVQLGPIY